MPKGLRRLHGGGDLHFITCSCYHRRKFLGSASRRDLFLTIFEEVRQAYDFVVVGYVVMPEHIHILTATATQTIQALVGGTSGAGYSVRVNNYSFAGPSSGHGSISNGSDVSKSR